jgi:hypothetical protein
MKKKNLDKLIAEVDQIAGFGAVVKYGRKLSRKEIKILADYGAEFGGSREHVESILKGLGRPYSIADPTYKSTCLICKALNNYCCC